MLYSSYKASHHIDRINKLRRGELIYPTQIQIDLTNTCNHRCPYCFYRCARNEYLNALFNEEDQIPTERVLALLEELKEVGVPAIQYTGGGEPFMHPGVYEILKKTQELGIEYAIVSNGAKIDLKHTDLLKDATWIRISLDAASKEVYGKSQKAPEEEFFTTLNNIRNIVKECPKVTVGISFVVNPLNYQEIVDVTKLARACGVSNIRFSVAYTPRGIELYKDKWSEIEKSAQEAKHLETKDFKVFNLVVAHLENLDLRQKGYTVCGYQHFTAVLGADQEVYPCCTLKYNSRTGFGNLKDKTFKEIWGGEKRKKWLSMDHLGLVCDKNPCWMDSKNRFISYLIQENPPHVNYI